MPRRGAIAAHRAPIVKAVWIDGRKLNAQPKKQKQNLSLLID